MNTTALMYLIATLIWSSTWYIIHFQLGSVPVIWSLVYRFALAGLLMVAIKKLFSHRHNSQTIPLKNQCILLLQGLSTGLSFYCIYEASNYLISGLTSLLFASIVFLNIFHSRIFFKTEISSRMWLGATLGLLSLAVMTFSQLEFNPKLSASPHMHLGVGLCLFASFIASLNNMLMAYQHNQGINSVQINTYTMLYATITLLLVALITKIPPTISFSFPYLTSLVYLSLIATTLAFWLYLILVKRVGPHKVAYMFIMIPIISAMISTVLEGFTWSPIIMLSFLGAIAGNYLVVKN